MANILIVHAHHESRSFSSALAKAAAETFSKQGHEVVFSDLHALGFDPVSDRRNFITTADATYLKQQVEEAHASASAGFVPELDAEMRKVEACDFLIFSFPLWWFGMPAILKGWVDRVFAYQRFYGRGHWYENGSGHGKRAMVLMTTGGGAEMYGSRGMHPPLGSILAPIHHGIFWFNGFSPLAPFVAWSAAHGGDADRHAVLDELRNRLQGALEEPPLQLPRAGDFDPETHVDRQARFMVTLKRSGAIDPLYQQLAVEQDRALDKLRREGRLLACESTPRDSMDWRSYLLFREQDQNAVETACATLPLKDYLDFEIVPLGSGN